MNFNSNSQLPEYHPSCGIVPPGCVSVETTVIITRILVGYPFPCHISHNPTSMLNSTNRFKAFRKESVDTGIPDIYLRIQEAQYVGHIPEIRLVCVQLLLRSRKIPLVLPSHMRLHLVFPPQTPVFLTGVTSPILCSMAGRDEVSCSY